MSSHPSDSLLRGRCFATGSEFAPVEVDVGEEEIADGEEEEVEGKGRRGHREVARDRIGDPGDEEVQGEDVGANHPLAMRDDLAVAGGCGR